MTEPTQEPTYALVTDPGTVWVLTVSRQGEEPTHRAISGLQLTRYPSGSVDVMPLDLGANNLQTYQTFDYTQSTNKNTGRISFSSNDAEYEVRAIALDDADWLFPGRDFLTLKQLNDTALES